MNHNNQIIAIEGQSLIDLSVQITGSVEGVFQMALLNNMAVDSTLEAGTELKKSATLSPDIASYLNNRGLKPAAGDTARYIYAEAGYVELNYWQ